MKKPSVLFVCTGNTCRSPMAEAIFASIASDKANVGSAGLFACEGDSITREAADALAGLGLKTDENHGARLLNADLVASSDYIVLMTESQKNMLLASPALRYGTMNNHSCVVMSSRDLIGRDIADPYGLGADEYAATAREILLMCKKLYTIIFGDERK